MRPQVRRRTNVAQTRPVIYNARTISSHVTGETPDSSSGTRWASTGKREISIAVRLGSQDGKQVEAARHSPHSPVGLHPIAPFAVRHPRLEYSMFAKDHTIAKVDPELWSAIQLENTRQQEHIELIASENYTSPAVMEAQGSQLTNKYAEGYPGKRYYGGCEYVDTIEQLAIDRAKELFGAEHANVQPHAGAQANM